MNDHATPATVTEGQLLADIRQIEARLAQLDGGDCAYEKALVRSYEQTVARHRERLAALCARR